MSSLSAPLLEVPGREALALAQARARTNQMSSRLRLLAHGADEEHDASSMHVEAMGDTDAPAPLQPIVVAPSYLESGRQVNTSRDSTSSDIATDSSSQRSSFSPLSEYSNTTAATTISEPVRQTFIEKHHGFPPSRGIPPMALDTSLSPTSPSYAPDSPLSYASISPVFQRRKENDEDSGSPNGNANSSVSPTSEVGVSTTSNKVSSSSGLPAHLISRTSSGGASTGNRNRIVGDGSSTQSRSRMRENSSPGLASLTMTKASAGKSVGSRSKGRVVGAVRNAGRAKAVSRKQSLSEVMKEAGEDLKRAMMFNIGSGSDDGSNTGSKSTGSGSELGVRKGAVSSQQQMVKDTGVALVASRKGKEKEGVPALEVLTVELMHELPRNDQWKGKEKEVDPVTDNGDKGKGKGKMKEKKEKSATIDRSAVSARVEDTIADPLLPGSGRRQIVITSDSEDYETETDSWSDSDDGEVDVPVARMDTKTSGNSQRRLQQQPNTQFQQLQLQKQQLQQQQQQHQQYNHHHQYQDPPPPQQARPHLLRTHSHNQGRNPRQLTRAQQQQLAHRLALEEAGERHWRENMFTKLPKSSFQNLAEVARTRSVGLLTQLLNPDPKVFPENHPYRRGFSSGAIQPRTALAPLAPIEPPPHRQQESQQAQQQTQVVDTLQLPPQAQQLQPPEDHNSRAGPSQQSRRRSRAYQMPQRMAALTKSSVGAAAKTPVATAVMSQLQVGSVNGVHGNRQTTTGGVSISVKRDSSKKGGYKSKAPPPDTVLEDSSEGENEEDDENRLDLSKSVAEEKLKALLEAKKKKMTGQPSGQSSHAPQASGSGHHEVLQPALPAEAIPIPMARPLFPYDLPAPNPPTTPRTTRRRMLQTELPESLRRNMLWERQVSQAHPRGLRRSASSGDVQNAARPMWAMPPVVRLTLKGTKPEEKEETKEEKRARFLARNRSWAYEYHYVGW